MRNDLTLIVFGDVLVYLDLLGLGIVPTTVGGRFSEELPDGPPYPRLHVDLFGCDAVVLRPLRADRSHFLRSHGRNHARTEVFPDRGPQRDREHARCV